MRERGRYREEGEGGWSERQIFGEWKVGGVRERESDGWMAGMPCPLLNSPPPRSISASVSADENKLWSVTPRRAGASEHRHGDGE